ncbi:rod shape-determining protein MreC [Candidatus Magnetominusculus xianensis]|uniref:Cell shape-determining protein MreC n=1 Tax=Candidatus Magnetominusculus xianensis TaxID=1748249 RepID=A0ABR5SKY3_9BACT|nr:rod shape-determining protein MreC [Candidatus Magnetominusculus xianensis]KWT93241.1 rod shape-determining protein MreC [Candidatus Magnetominusculus xianensis]MBF0404745.1 rod shape-determining protein MreC [Nitrospirota bacterium]
MTKRSQALFLVYLFFCISLMSIQSIKGPLQPLFFIRYPLNYINEAVTSLIYYIKRPFVVALNLERQNEQLKKELDILLLKKQEYEETIIENARLRQLLDLKQQVPEYVTTAKVILKNPDMWAQTLEINKGYKDGVTKDMTVRTVQGLIGKIKRADAHHSIVLLLTDVSSSAAVKSQDNRTEAILVGVGEDYCNLKHGVDMEKTAVGDIIITSGLDSLYPAGVPVGKVISSEKNPTMFEQDVKVALFANPQKIDEVMVITRSRDM